MTLKLPDDLADRLSDLQKRSDMLVKKALEEGGKVVLKQAQSNLNSVVGKGTKYDSRATGELEHSLGLSPVKENGAGRDIKVGFPSRIPAVSATPCWRRFWNTASTVRRQSRL